MKKNPHTESGRDQGKEHPLFGPRLKIQRAGEQFKDLRAAIKAFLKGKPYDIERQVDLDAKMIRYVVRIRKSVPPMWSAIVGEVIHDFRSALDYLVWQLVIHETGAPPTSNKTQYPIFETEAGFNSRG